MNKILTALLTTCIIFTNFSNYVSASETTLTEYVPQENKGATVTFVDESMIENNSATKARGAIVMQYSHSYYTYVNRSIIAWYVGPRENDVFLCSVAAGKTKQVEEEKTISGSISFTGEVNANIKKTVSLGFGLTASGTYSKTWKTTETFTGPADGKYNSYSFYGAIDYDKYTTTVKRYDVYNYVDSNSGTITGTETLYHSTMTIDNVKCPKAVEYSIGDNYS